MPAEANVEDLPNMEGDNYPDGMDVFVDHYRNLHVQGFLYKFVWGNG